MSHGGGQQFRTHTIRFFKRDIEIGRNYRSLFGRIDNKKHCCCGSLLQIVKFYEDQRKKRTKVDEGPFLTISNDFDRQCTPKSQEQKIQKRRFSLDQSQTPKNSLKNELKHQFRVKEGHRINPSRKQKQKMEFDKLINDFNTKTKEILSRKERSHFLRRSIQKNEPIEPRQAQPSHNFYHFRTIKNFKQTLSTKQESEDLEINYEITPW